MGSGSTKRKCIGITMRVKHKMYCCKSTLFSDLIRVLLAVKLFYMPSLLLIHSTVERNFFQVSKHNLSF